MRPIPKKLRSDLSDSQHMDCCCYPHCEGAPEWEHVWILAGRQLNEKWAIIPVCYHHHRGGGIVKRYHEWWSLNYAKFIEIDPYTISSRKNWGQIRESLNEEYGGYELWLKVYQLHLQKCEKSGSL